jgi:transcriptional regulator with XRE-family HTH domain
MKNELFSTRLRRFRVARGVKMKEMALHLGVSTSTYRDWEYGRAIKGEPYPKMADILSVSLAELLTGHEVVPDQLMKEVLKCEQALLDLKKKLASFF